MMITLTATAAAAAAVVAVVMRILAINPRIPGPDGKPKTLLTPEKYRRNYLRNLVSFRVL